MVSWFRHSRPTRRRSPAGDAPGLDSAAAAFEQMGAVLYAGEAAASAACRYREQGRTGSALTAAARAKRFADRCEGARTPALRALDASLPLTEREYEIAGLAARGPSNKQIAERLVVSVRTVDNHLHNAYSNLNVAHRDQLATILLPKI
jgi:ATP/maltotriose-dependent transcriptional regulator MalT